MKVTQWKCLTLCDPMDYTVHGILQARILEWVTFPFSRGYFQPRDPTQVSHISGGFFTNWAIREAQEYWSEQPIPSPADLPDPEIELASPALQVGSLRTETSEKPYFYVVIWKLRMYAVYPIINDIRHIINFVIKMLLYLQKMLKMQHFLKSKTLDIFWNK